MIHAPSVVPGPPGRSTSPAEVDPLRGDAVALLAAHRHLTLDLCPKVLPQRAVEAACALTGAGFGVLRTVAAPVRTLFATPCDDGPGELLERTLDTAGDSDLARALDLDAAGFLSATVRVRGLPHAQLHLYRCRCADARDHGPFDAAAAARLEAFAAAAGSVFETSLVHRESVRTRDWLHASGEITRALLAEDDDELLVAALERLIAIADADAASLLLPAGNGALQVLLSLGVGRDTSRGLVLHPARSPLARSLVAGRSVLTADLLTYASEGFVNVNHLGPLLAAPLVDARGVRGAIVLSRSATAAPFVHADLELVGTFADQLTVALDLADSRLRGQRLSLLEERHRIAQDLHDNVMQRLFATGVGLQGLLAGLDADTAERLARHVADLDETIDQIRTRVFDLRATSSEASGSTGAETGYVR